MPDLKQALKDFVATSNSARYDENTLYSKFPELRGYDRQALKDYVATANSGKYTSEDELNSKFPELFNVKKKDSPNSTSSTPKPSSESVQKDGSSDIPKFKIKDERLESLAVKENSQSGKDRRVTTDINQLQQENENFKQLVKPKLAEYRNSTRLDQNAELEAKQELEEVKNQQGILNNVKALATQAGNYITTGAFKKDNPLQTEIKDAKIELGKAGIKKPSEEQINKKAEEIFVANKLKEKKQQKINDYLGSLDEQTKTYLEADASVKFKTLSRETKEVTDRIALNSKYADAIVDDLKNPNLLPQDRLNYEAELSQIAKEIDEDFVTYQKSDKELGSYEEEFDAFKRNYGALENFSSRVVSSIANTAVDLYSGANYVANTLGAGEEFKQVGIAESKKRINEFDETFRPDNKEINSGNFWQYTFDLLADQSSTLIAMGTGGVAGGASVLGVAGAGEKYSEMFQEEMKYGVKYSAWQKAIAPLLAGGSTAILSATPTGQILQNTKRLVQSALKDKVARESMSLAIKNTANTLAKQYGSNMGKEVPTEMMDNILQNAIDKEILGKEVGYFDNSWKVLKETGLMTAMISTPGAMSSLAMKGASYFAKPEATKTLEDNAKRITLLSRELENEEIDPTAEKVIKSQIKSLTKESGKIVDATLDRIATLSDDDVKKIVSNNRKLDEYTSKAESIKNTDLLDVDTKKVILEGLKQDFIKTRDSQETILNSEPLPKAKNEEKPQPEQEAQPQAEKQEKVNEVIVSELEYKRFVNTGMVSDVRLSDIAEKVKNKESLTPRENEIFVDKKDRINKIIADAGIQESNSVVNGNDGLGVNTMGESGISDQEIVGTQGVSETVDSGISKGNPEIESDENLKHVISEIDYGVLNWSGDTGSPRVVLGISWADIRKGEKDIKSGKLNTVPAKRLTEALLKAKENGGYEYMQGAGNDIQRQFVSLDKVNNQDYQFTESELEIINENDIKLELEYEQWFNELNEETQIEILENYEYRQAEENNSREVGGDSKIGESQTAVSNEQGKADRKTERIAIANAKIDDLADWAKDFFPKADIDFNDYKTQGVSQDALIDIVSKLAKTLVKTGIEIDEAIRQVVDRMRQRFDSVSIDIEDVKAKMKPTEIPSELTNLIKNVPKSNEIKEYLSGDTIEKYEGAKPENDQDYNVQGLNIALEHGVKIVNAFKELFGDSYVDESLAYLEDNLLMPEQKALFYVSLENDLASRKLTDDSVGLSKLQELVRTKSQAFARSSSLAINFGRLRKFAELGYDITKVTNQFFSPAQLEAKSKIEKAIQADPNAINKEAEQEEGFEISVEPTRKPRDKKQVQSDISETLKQMRRDLLKAAKGDSAMSSIPYVAQLAAASPHILKLGKLFVELGGMTAKEIIKEISENIKDIAPDIDMDDIRNLLSKNPEENQAKKLVKEALIEKGYGREITVTRKTIGEDGSAVKVKEKRKVIDWKKLAGEEGSIDKIKANVESALKNRGFSEDMIADMQKALEDEYNNLRASIIEKSITELQNRNKPRKPLEIKTSAKRLAELYNYGLFEKNAAEYDHLLNSSIGLTPLSEKSFIEAKALAKSLAELYSSRDKDGNLISEFGLRQAVRTINKKIEQLLTNVAWKESNGIYKAAIISKEYVGLAQRMMLHSLGQFIENPLSGFIQRGFTKIGYAFDGTEDKALAQRRRQGSRNIYEDTVRNGGLDYGDITTPLVSKSLVEDILNQKNNNKAKHTLLSTFMGRAFLEGADSMHKSALTEKYFAYNLIKVLSDKSNPNRMSKKEALNYVSEQLTGQSFSDALKLAKEITDKANIDAGKKVLPDTKEAVYRLAEDIVKDALVKGEKLTLKEIESSYKAAYKAAGFDLGHEANNPISKMVSNEGSKIEFAMERAIKEKKWNEAAAYAFTSILTRNILNPFVGGGTNWVVLTLQKTGIDPISPLVNYARAKDNRLDLSTEEGIKNIEKSLTESLKSKNTNNRVLIGAMVSLVIAGSLMVSGGEDEDDDKLNKWLRKNDWAKKYFNKVSPQVLIALLAAENKELGKYFAQLFNVRTDSFSESAKVGRAIDQASKGKYEKAKGSAGDVVGSRLSAPVPFRFVRDIDNIIRGVNGKDKIKVDYKSSGFWNGYFKGGLIEYLGKRPEGSRSENLDKPKNPERLKSPTRTSR